ncbi:uncharacterized protein LOC141640851 [Silene latifolia]|uniref:uncharacterized protein LOC141640851 n=1 Tax=Silene latifolia TaxID=37657 RepID=UPI003D784F60
MTKIKNDSWNLNGFPLVFKDWSPTIAEELTYVSTAPIWVLFPNLDPCFWSASGLSKVASSVGKPICADEVTIRKSKLAFAKVLIEVDISKELPDKCRAGQKRVYKPKTTQSAALVTEVAKVVTVPVVVELEPEAPALVGQQEMDHETPEETFVVDGEMNTPPTVHLDGEGFGRPHTKSQPAQSKIVVSVTLDNKFQELTTDDTWQNEETQQENEKMVDDAHDPGGGQRRALWDALDNIALGFSFPWLCLGDFNVTLTVEERLGSDQVRYGDMEEFKECLEACGLSDLPVTGLTYTWSNRNGGHLKWAKLDRILGQSNWLTSTSSTIYFLPAGVSNHSPMWVQVQSGAHTKRSAFKYLESWSMFKNFHSCVLKHWARHFHGGKISILFQNLKQLKKGLKEIHCNEFSGISGRVKAVKDGLLSCQAQLGGHVMNTMLVDKVKALTHSYVALRKVEMSILK